LKRNEFLVIENADHEITVGSVAQAQYRPLPETNAPIGVLVQLGEMRTVSNRAGIRCTGQLLTIDHVIAFGIHWRAWPVKVRSVTSTFSEKKAVRGSVLVSVRAADGAKAVDWAVWETG
jgi:hypothetical protein